MKERPILSATTGKPSRRGKRDPQRSLFDWNAMNKPARNERRRDLYKSDSERQRERTRAYRRANPDKVLEYNAKWRRQFFGGLRTEMIATYGGKCACCGEQESIFLDLDHINNDGAADRRERGNGQRLLVWLKANDWPRDRYQLLCCNCNQGKARNGGVCPHATGDRQ